MTDITKCHGRNCKSALRCYRYTAAGDKYAQSYADFEAMLDADNWICPEFRKIEDRYETRLVPLWDNYK